MQVNRKRFVLIVIAIIISNYFSRVEAETIGRTWLIAEIDILNEIEKRAAQVTIDPETMKKRINQHIPKDNVRLPKASESRTYAPDMSYILTFDIKDANGMIIYPKGYRFDPMPYLWMPITVIVFNPDDPEQLDWFMRHYNGEIDVQVLITNGNYQTIGKKLGQTVYYLPEIMVKRFQLKAVPVVIKQVNQQIIIDEIDVSQTN